MYGIYSASVAANTATLLVSSEDVDRVVRFDDNINFGFTSSTAIFGYNSSNPFFVLPAGEEVWVKLSSPRDVRALVTKPESGKITFTCS